MHQLSFAQPQGRDEPRLITATEHQMSSSGMADCTGRKRMRTVAWRELLLQLQKPQL